MELKEVFDARRSVRKFKDIQVADEVIEDILHAANTAPCTDTCNYYFGVVSNKTMKHAIADQTVWANWVEQAPVIFVCCSQIQTDIQDQKTDSYMIQGLIGRYGEEIVNLLQNVENRKACKTLLNVAPVYIAAQHMILAAVAHGLRGCLVDFIKIEAINQLLNLPPHITCELLVPIGYPDEVPTPIKVNDKDNIFFDRWNQ